MATTADVAGGGHRVRRSGDALAGLLARIHPRFPARRRRDWVVDTVLLVLALGTVWLSIDGQARAWQLMPDWWVVIDVIAGLVSAVALWWRRRYPVGLALVMVLLGGPFLTAGFATLVSVYTVASLRSARVAAAITALHLCIAIPYFLVFPVTEEGFVAWTITMALVYLVALILGIAVRARREVITGLIRSAERDRSDYEQRLQQVRRDERAAMAREMHDVLAHRISILSVHAGALEYRGRQRDGPALSPAELQAAVGVIRASAHQALEDLREVLSVLDPAVEPTDGGEPGSGQEPPQPTVAQLADLVREARAAGQVVRLSVADGLAGLRTQTQRAIYRVVQEGLTNARKHAPGAAVDVGVELGVDVGVDVDVGTTAEDVRVLVRNALPVGTTSAEIPGAGAGLTGLAERVRLEGGLLTTSVRDGSFWLEANLPCRM